MSNKIVVAVFMLFLILMISLYLGSQNYNGFAFAKSKLSEYPYEGFATYQEAFDMREDADSKNLKAEVPTTVVPLATPSTFANSASPHTQSVAAVLKTDSNKSDGKDTKEGFETLTGSKPANLAGSSYVDEKKPVAFLYNNDANTTCKNYGYTNSKGFICMSSSDIQLLTTRGGNASGVSDQIGK
jgi:hypothetical protein